MTVFNCQQKVCSFYTVLELVNLKLWHLCGFTEESYISNFNFHHMFHFFWTEESHHSWQQSNRSAQTVPQLGWEVRKLLMNKVNLVTGKTDALVHVTGFIKGLLHWISRHCTIVYIFSSVSFKIKISKCSDRIINAFKHAFWFILTVVFVFALQRKDRSSRYLPAWTWALSYNVLMIVCYWTVWGCFFYSNRDGVTWLRSQMRMKLSRRSLRNIAEGNETHFTRLCLNLLKKYLGLGYVVVTCFLSPNVKWISVWPCDQMNASTKCSQQLSQSFGHVIDCVCLSFYSTNKSHATQVVNTQILRNRHASWLG